MRTHRSPTRSSARKDAQLSDCGCDNCVSGLGDGDGAPCRCRGGRRGHGGGGAARSACETLPRRARAGEAARRSAACKHARAREPQAHTRGRGRRRSLVPLDCGLRTRRPSKSAAKHTKQEARRSIRARRTPSMRTNGRATWVCHSWGALRMRLFNVSRLPRDAASACQQWCRRRRRRRRGRGRLTSWCSGRSRRLHVAWRANMALAWTWIWCAMCDVPGSQSRESGRAPGKW